ncbi:MAG: hypothetical protein JWN35_3467 [Frankiales bacterium]|nr:hypothetical protein [Frankiales bacterium]
MTGYEVCLLVLAVAGLGPALLVSSRGDPLDRLVGLELTSAVALVFTLVLSQVAGQSYYLAVPLVMVPLSFAGTLVFTRLLAPRRRSS